MHPLTTRSTSTLPGRRTIAAATAALAIATGLLIASSGAGTGGLSLTLTSAEATTAAAKMDIKSNTFTKPELTIKLGESVTWTNLDDVPHNVVTTRAPVEIDSGIFKKGESFTYEFTVPGTYNYYCAVHPEMVGKVVVLDKDGAAVPDEPAAPSESPLSSVFGPLFPKTSALQPGTVNPDDDPTTEHAPGSTHGDNSSEETAAGTSDNGAAPSSVYPYQPAADPVSGAVDPLIKHLEAAHFTRGAGAQVQDIAEFDSWAKSHQVLARQMTEYFQGKDSVYGSDPNLGKFAKHMDNAHYNTSPMGQASAIANFDSWNRSHLALIRAMADPAVGRDSALGTAPAAGVLMKHLDSAHWNTSVNGQVTAITDDPAGWVDSHAALAQAMIASGAAAMGGQEEPGHSAHGPQE
jgi:amicyanin